MTRGPALALVALVAALALTACGKQGDLDRPAPLWGDKAKADYAAQQRQAADERAKGPGGNQIEPLPADGNAAANAAQP